MSRCCSGGVTVTGATVVGPGPACRGTQSICALVSLDSNADVTGTAAGDVTGAAAGYVIVRGAAVGYVTGAAVVMSQVLQLLAGCCLGLPARVPAVLISTGHDQQWQPTIGMGICTDLSAATFSVWLLLPPELHRIATMHTA